MRRSDLNPDCGSCAALCCTATSFDASEDFAFSKAAGEPCTYLQPDCRCAIHDDLAVRGFTGCTVYDCYGAGPRATRAYSGPQRQEAFLALRVVHELLWLLTEAAKLCPSSSAELVAQVAREVAALDGLARDPTLLETDVRPRRNATRALLRRVGEAVGGRRAAASRLMVLA